MRKAFLLLIPILIWGCEQTYDNVIDTSTQNYQVTSIEGLKDTISISVPGDSVLNLKLVFSPESELNNAYFNIFSSNFNQLNSSPMEMVETNDNEFENQFVLTSQNPIGVYTVQFTVTGTNGINKVVATSNFYFDNGQLNSPPIISNTVIDPDTVVVTQPTILFTSVEASDPNGTSDILEVFFIVYRPDGTSNGSRVQLFDDGSSSNGDVTAGDGIYSRLIQVDQTNQKGTYRFQFQAEDRSGALSNIINHYVLIQ